MVVVGTFPHAPIGLSSMIDALAMEASEPPAASFKTAGSWQSDPWVSMESYIYRNKHVSIQAAGNAAMTLRTQLTASDVFGH